MDIGYGQKMLTRCLKGGGLRGEVPNIILPLHYGDTLYMCTDGFYNIHEQELSSGNAIAPKEGIMNDDATCLTLKIN